MLIVLDNARDTEQVAPLLPAGSSCSVLITSRKRLAGLVTAHNAQPMPLGTLSAEEARDLLTNRFAARAEAFRLLGLAPSPDIGLPAAAALIGVKEERAARVLADLELASLIEQYVQGRYRMHDLIRLYAAERAERDHNRNRREAAMRRVLDFYARTATRVLGPTTEDDRAWPWLAAEHACLQAAQHKAADLGLHRAVWKLARALDTFHYRGGQAEEQIAACRAGLDAARQLNNPDSLARAYRLLGGACTRAHRYEEAIAHLDKALLLARSSGNRPSRAKTHQALARAWEKLGVCERARDHATEALALHRALGNTTGEARALNQVGWSLAQLGDLEGAEQHCTAAASLFRRADDRHGQANTLDSLGYIAHLDGRCGPAVDHYEQALALFRTLGDQYHQADTLARMARAHAARGHAEPAAAWQQALRLYRTQHRDSEAQRVRQEAESAGLLDGGRSQARPY
ncbi:tetratricopeptide repeat protein [Streptomyces sp. NPDC086554]|uniref:tetratricopeptide repeat protein n=1 Tax=Streptomyces sp. NPDC086554 TaxID=3154864 RepID=UPI003419A73A